MRTGPPVGAHPAPTRLVSAPPRAAAWPCWWLHVAAVRERREEGGGEAELAALLLLLCAARHHALRLAPWQNHRLQKPHCSPHVSSPRPRLDEWAAGLGEAPYGGVRGAGTPPTPHSCSVQSWEPPRPPWCRFLSPHAGCVRRETPVSKKAPEGNRESEKKRAGGEQESSGPPPARGGLGALPANRTRLPAAPPVGETEARGGRLCTPALSSAAAGMTPAPPAPPAPPCSCRNPRAPEPGAPPAPPLPPAHGTAIGSGLAPHRVPQRGTATSAPRPGRFPLRLPAMPTGRGGGRWKQRAKESGARGKG